MVIDDHSLLGNVGWIQQTRSHDAVLLKFRKSDWQADLAVAYNNEDAELFRTRYSLNNYRSLFFLWINKSFSDILKISVTGIVDGFQAADTANPKKAIDKVLGSEIDAVLSYNILVPLIF